MDVEVLLVFRRQINGRMLQSPVNIELKGKENREAHHKPKTSVRLFVYGAAYCAGERLCDISSAKA